MARRFVLCWLAASTAVLCIAAFAYAPYLFPGILSGAPLAWAYEIRYGFVMFIARVFGPTNSVPLLAAKVALSALTVGFVLALFGLLIPRRKAA